MAYLALPFLLLSLASAQAAGQPSAAIDHLATDAEGKWFWKTGFGGGYSLGGGPSTVFSTPTVFPGTVTVTETDYVTITGTATTIIVTANPGASTVTETIETTIISDCTPATVTLSPESTPVLTTLTSFTTIPIITTVTE